MTDPGWQPPPVSRTPGWPPARDPDARPFTVTAAGWISIVSSAIPLLCFGAGAVAFVGWHDSFVDWVASAFTDDTDVDGQEVGEVLGWFLLVVSAWAAASIVLAVGALRRSNPARILLVGSAALSVVVNVLLGVFLVVPFVLVVTAVTAVVLFFTGGANQWYAARGHPPDLPLGTTQPWG